MQAHGLLSTLVISLVLACAFGFVARRLALPPLVGYLLAGIAVGPFTPGYVANQAVANELADVGVALLLFGVGLHFSPADLWRVRTIAVPGALVQIALSCAAGFGVAYGLLGTSALGAVIVGLCLAIASTAVATRALAERGQLDTAVGRIALGWLVVQDIVVILAMVVLPVFAGAGGSSGWLRGLGAVTLQLAAFIVAVVLVGRRVIPWLLGEVARVGSRELFTLSVVVIALGIASLSTEVFGVSLALGAFFAGVMLGESDLSHQAAAEALPIQHIFTVLFFVSVGMLFDPMSLGRAPLAVGAMLLAVILATGLSTIVILLVARRSVETAGLIGAAFAQIGEFSFILTELAVGRGLIDSAVRDVVLATALVAILLNTPVFHLALRVAPWIASMPVLARWRSVSGDDAFRAPLTLRDHAIVVGHGRVGQIVAEALERHGLPFVVIDVDRPLVEALRASGRTVIYGDATRPGVLAAAGVSGARLLIAALPDAFHTRHVLAATRKANPAIEAIVRTHSDQEAAYLEETGVELVVMGEREIAFGLTDFALQALGVPAAQAQATVNSLRRPAKG